MDTKETLPTGGAPRLICAECVAAMRRLSAASVDLIIADPPYGYLNGTPADVAFDEDGFLAEVRRVLKPGGFIALFGRGTPFYRWNVRLASLGFTFKEEVVWDKRRTSSSYLPLARTHETATLHSLGEGGKIRRVRLPYVEKNQLEPVKIAKDVERLMSALGTQGREWQAVRDYLAGRTVEQTAIRSQFNITGCRKLKNPPPVDAVRRIQEGVPASDVAAIFEPLGGRIHPTQKPVELMRLLVRLTTDPGALILDPFAGSGSAALACMDTGRRYLGFELCPEFHAAATRRIKEHQPGLFG